MTVRELSFLWFLLESWCGSAKMSSIFKKLSPLFNHSGFILNRKSKVKQLGNTGTYRKNCSLTAYRLFRNHTGKADVAATLLPKTPSPYLPVISKSQ